MTTTGDLQVTSFLGAQDVLAANLVAYTRRPLQENLAAAIEQAIEAKRHLLANAGTGIGKSLAGLIPAIIWAKQNHQRVVVATSTKALQTQYAQKDLPFLQEFLGIPFTWAVIKGRSNYACMAKIDQLAHPTPGQLAIIREVTPEHFNHEVPIGDRDELPVVTNSEWSMLSMGAAECPGKVDCPFASELEFPDEPYNPSTNPRVLRCHTERAKAKAAEADIVITNTAYLITDMKLRKASNGAVNLLGDYGLLIIDEAHNIESAVTSALSETFSETAFRRLAADADGYLRIMGFGDDDSCDRVAGLADQLWARLADFYAAFVERNKGKADPCQLYQAQIVRDFKEEFIGLYEALLEVYRQLEATDPEDRTAKFARNRLMSRALNWIGTLKDVMYEKDIDVCRWVEEQETLSHGTKRTRLFLRTAPVSAAPFLRENVWPNSPVVMMSATLAVGTVQDRSRPDFGQADFTYIRETLGLRPGEVATFDAGSPFDYPRQARVFVPEKTVPAPAGATQMEWRSWAQEATRYLVTQAGGGALLLYTSRSAMNDAHRRLAPAFEAQGLTVLKQDDAVPAQLIRAFKEDGNAVLFGLRTFMEGIDVQGAALRLVMLDKLPFSVPTDIHFKARCSRVDQLAGKKVSFYQLSVPEMALTLIQAFGRLIRHTDDKGVVAILDSRLTSKSYGQVILNALPPAPVTRNIREVAAFFAS